MPGVLLALWGAGAPRVGIFADLYSYMADVADASDRQVDTVHKISRRVVRRCLDSLDAVVVLTSAMDALINRESKPSVVMEGLVDVNQSARAVSLANRHTHPTALYAGALRREYGVEDLVLGFRSIPDPQARLEIYGQGDYAEEVRRHAAEDTRITFAGTVPVEVVLEAEERAWVLVNPRPANQEFTKYSFPSKNMEYLASGTAVLTTPLPGMPPEYYPHVMLIDESSPAGVRGALERAFALGRGELHRRGERGKEFVLTSKTNTIWAGKLLALARRAGA
ncbi:MAG: glycosyltransferase [Tetrasphaera sp.]